MGYKNSWNAGTCCGSAKERDVDDVGFISEIMDILIRDHNVDEKQIYVTGHSNGGMMTYRVACELGDRIRGAIPFVGAISIKKQYNPKNWVEPGYFAGKDEVANTTMTAYPWNPEFTADKWYQLDEWYSCKASPGTDWMIINGSKDAVVPLGGLFMESSDRKNDPENSLTPATYGPYYLRR